MDTPECTTNDKQCSTCKQYFPRTSEYFPPRNDAKDGLRGQCWTCRRAVRIEYYSNNRDEILAYTHQYSREHSAEIGERARLWCLAHPDRVREYQRQRRITHREEERARHQRERDEYPERVREYSHRSYLKHREAKLATGRAYRHANRERYRCHTRNRHAAIKGAEGKWTEADVALQLRTQKGLCWWCGVALNGVFHRDHRIPLTRGGSNAPENLCLTCPKCNLSKNNKLPSEWSDRLL